MSLQKCSVEPACVLTAGDLARWLEVDLKTVHNWVRRGYLAGRRTNGGHRRFYRAEVVRYLRASGRSLPKQLTQPAAALCMVGCFEGAEIAQRLAARVESNLFEALLAVAEGRYEIVVIELASFEPALVTEFLATLRGRALSRGAVTVGVSDVAAQRAAFEASGGAVALASCAELERVVPWLVGAASEPSASREQSLDEPSAKRATSQSGIVARVSVPRRSTR